MSNKSRPPYLLGLLCLIPLVGGFVGIALIFYGIFKYKSKWLTAIGVFGLLFTVGIYSFVYFHIKYSDSAGRGFAKISQKDLNILVQEIESYKLRTGQYPDDLEQLSKSNENIIVIDPLLARKLNNNQSNYFHYQKENSGTQYILFSVGVDGIANTPDDIYPNVAINHNGFIKP